MPILHLILSSPKVNIPVSVKFLSDTTADVNVQTEFRSAARGGSEPKKLGGDQIHNSRGSWRDVLPSLPFYLHENVPANGVCVRAMEGFDRAALCGQEIKWRTRCSI